MFKLLLLFVIVNFSHGFLLDNSNTSLPVKQAYLTLAEYYEDKSQLHHEQEAFRDQQQKEQFAYRDQQEKALKLLADQLQQRLLAMEQKINEKHEPNQQTMALTEQRYHDLVQKYQELENKYTDLERTSTTQIQMCLNNNTKLHNKIDNLEANVDYFTNKTNDLKLELQQLQQLKSVNQLQTLSKLAEKVNTFDSRINLLSGHEQSRNQDFLALYNLTTVTSNRLTQMEAEHNTSLLTLQQEEKQIKYNFTSSLEMLTNATKSEIDVLGQSLNMSVTQLRRTVNHNNEKVVLVGCNHQDTYYSSGSTYKFPTIVTKVGLYRLTQFSSTGKFICPVSGIYHISTLLTTDKDNVFIYIMKNAVSVHQQYINGYSFSGTKHIWTPGTAIIALELNFNDTVWIKTGTVANLLYSCLTIFKL